MFGTLFWRTTTITAATAGAALIGPGTAAHAQCDAAWQSGPSFPSVFVGTQSDVRASVVWDPDGSGPAQPKLVVAGDFTQAGGISANRVAYWDGTNYWNFLQGLNGTVNTLAVLNDQLYAGGAFTLSGATTVNRVARWNATTNAWVAVGQGFNDEVYALTVHEGQLVAAGRLTSSGATTGLNRIAIFNGTSWNPLGTGVQGYVWSIKSWGGRLYVGGEFSTAGGLSVTNCAFWTAAGGWKRMGVNGAFNGAFGGKVLCMTNLGTDLLLGGDFTSVGGTIPSSGVARFTPNATDGTWAQHPNWAGAGDFTVYGLLSDGSDTVYAAGGDGGATAVKKWTSSSPTTWTPIGGAISGGFAGRCLTFYNGQIILGGDFFTLGGGPSLNHVARLSGSTFLPLTPGINGSVGAFAQFGGLVAGGDFEQRGTDGSLCRGIISSGTTGVGSVGVIDGTVNALFVRGNGVALPTLIAAGVFDRADGTPGMSNIAQRALVEPAFWTAMGSGFQNSAPGFNAPVFALAGYGSSGGPLGQPIVYAGGFFTNSGATVVNNIARFVSGAWQPLGGGVNSSNAFKWVNALSVFQSKLFVGGVFDTADGQTANSIAAWNGTVWSLLGSGVRIGSTKGVVNAMAVYQSQLWVGGRFDSAGGLPASGLARWDGAAWNIVPAPGTTDEEISAMAVHFGRLYVATNNFNVPSGTEGRVYRWSGSGWTPVPGAIADGGIARMASMSGDLHVGGSFTNLGGFYSPAWARLNCACPADADGDGQIAPADISSYINLWLDNVTAGGLEADFDNDGAITPSDVASFVSLWYTVLSTGSC